MNSTILVLIVIAVVVILMNIVTFSMYAMDKSKAKQGKWRISEATLIACGFFMGGIGAFIAMRVLRHKTQHIKFKILVPVAMLLNAIVIFLVLFALGLFPFP